MKKLPSYLKGLVEARARSAGDIERLEQLRLLLDEEIATAHKLQDAADTLIREFSPLLDPSQIQPVRSRMGRKGKVKEVIDQILQDASPLSLPTPEISFLVAEKIQLRFLSVAEYRKWAKNAVNRELHRKWAAGTVERLQTPGQETRWKIVAGEQVTSLETLKALST